MRYPEFTVLMCVYDGDDAALFQRALASIFANTLQPAAVVLVMDGPVNGLLGAVIDEFKAFASLKVVLNDEPLGFASALNKGIAQVETEWIVRADADDINLPTRFALLADRMQEDIDLVGSFVAEMDEAGKAYAVRSVPLQHDDIRSYLARRNPFNHMSVAYRCNLVRRCGGYPHIPVREDYGLWASMLAKGARCENIDTILVHASAGEKLYRRRRGWRSFLAEYQLQRHLLRCGVTTVVRAIIFGTLRGVVLTMPSTAIARVYRIFLRQNPNHMIE
jgi:glycosyltransferase involved in cell wall biosynthesis